MKKINLLFAALLIMLVAAAPVFSADIHVPIDYTTIQAAINAANPGDNIIVDAGTYTETFIVNKQVNILGANADINPNTGTRGPETILDYSSVPGNVNLITVNSSGKVVINGFKFIDNDNTATGNRHVIYVSTYAAHEFKFNVFERIAAVHNSSANPRGIHISPAAAGSLTIEQNLFKGGSTADIWSNRTFRSGIWSDGGAVTTNITNNVFKYCRAAINADGYSSGMNLTGNTFQDNGTHVSIGGNPLPTGSYTVSGNTFINTAGTTVWNLSGVAAGFLLDASNNTYDGVLPSAMTIAQLFEMEYRTVNMFNVGKNGFVIYKPNNIYMVEPVAGLSPQKTASLESAYGYAQSGWIINVAEGSFNVPSQITMNKTNVSIKGQGINSKIFVSGTGHRFLILAGNNTIEGLNIEKTDKAGVQNIIGIQASNAVIKNNIIHGQFVIGDNDPASRAMEISGGISGLIIEGNTLYSLRQPAYINSAAGNVINNYVYLTRGWVLHGSIMTFNGNTWGSGANSNVYDIAILAGTPSSDILTMSNANNGAVIEDQRVSPAVLSVVYVDASTSFSTDLGGRYHPYSSITPAITRVVSGGKINVAAGTYNEDVTVSKPCILSGAGKDVTTIIGPIGEPKVTVLLGANNITLEGFTITRAGNNPTDWTNPLLNSEGVNIGQLTTGSIIQNCKFIGNRTGIYFNNTNGHTIQNNIITFNRTGIQLVNQVSNNIIQNNEITNNWTLGVVIYYASVGMPASTGVLVNNNNISGNWYSQVECKTVSGHPNATVAYNFENNWFGSSTLNVTNSPAGEPPHDSQIPVEYGGSAVNPGTGVAKISGDLVAKIDYDPWIGKAETFNLTNANLNQILNFTEADASLTFTTLPPNTNANLAVSASPYLPSGLPLPPAAAGANAGVYLNITASGLTNYAFSCTVVLDVSSIPGFSAATEVMYYNTTSGSWVGMNGIFDPVAQTFTFVTDHFTQFAFVNPMNPVSLYLSQDAALPQTTQEWYPYAGMGTGTKYGSNDWSYIGATGSFYVVPTGTQGIFGSEFMIEWDKTKTNITVTNGNYWGSNVFYQAIDSSVGNQGRYWVNIFSSDLSNVAPDTAAGKYLAKIDFTITKPGYIPFNITSTDFRYWNGSWYEDVYITTNSGKIKLYLGDFERQTPPSPNFGDGKINFVDVSPFGGAYWAYNTNPLYRTKYDIGPVSSPNALPAPDNKIEFEDLMIFAIGYGKFGAGQLPQNPLQIPIKVTAQNGEYRPDGMIQIPVKVEGAVTDLRGFSLNLLHSSNLEYYGVEKAGEMLDGLTFLAGKNNGSNSVMIDGAVISDASINKDGYILNVIFKVTGTGKHEALISSAILRNSNNTDLLVDLNGGTLTEIPTVFDLKQNYPNPFNPSTTIKYQLPVASMVTLKIFDMTGKEVASLVNGVNQEPGYYSIEWNAKNYASGVYFYKIEAGDFTSVKKMILVK